MNFGNDTPILGEVNDVELTDLTIKSNVIPRKRSIIKFFIIILIIMSIIGLIGIILKALFGKHH